MLFQYPLFRIVDCFIRLGMATATASTCFNIRSFGSWIASQVIMFFPFRLLAVSISALSDRGLLLAAQRAIFPNWLFQYPLFRIVDCFPTDSLQRVADALFQYPLFRIVDCFKLVLYSAGLSPCCFNIRSFGSWIASRFRRPQAPRSPVSISALSDRGLLRVGRLWHRSAIVSFNIRSFGSWIASTSSAFGGTTGY